MAAKSRAVRPGPCDAPPEPIARKKPGRSAYRPTIPMREKPRRRAIAPQSPSLRRGATPAGMGPSPGDSRRGGRRDRPGQSRRLCALRAGWPWRLPARAPTDPYVLTLEHTVPQPTASPPPKMYR
jgi:hypothetical protein